MLEEHRCPNCSALVAEGADWCGQCFTSLAPQPEPVEEAPDALDETPALAVAPTGEGAEATEAAPGVPVWACPVCDNENDIDLMLCPMCGTPFAKLFEEPDATPRIEPSRAALLGLLPGLGHIRAGRTGEGVARMFVWIASMFSLALFALSTDAGVASMVLTTLFAILVLFTVAESVVDAYRLSRGERELLSGRWMLWIFLGAFGLAVGLVVVLSMAQRPPAT